MLKLDLKDRKILYYLDVDSRQSFSSIGKKVGLHRKNVVHRVNKLKEEGVIFNFFTYIDPSKLGYNIVRFYFVLQYTTPEIKKKIIEELVNSKYSLYVNICEGQIDLSVYFAVKNIYKFQHVWDQFLRKYRNYFARTLFSHFCYENMYNYSLLLDENSEKITDRTNVMNYGGGPKIEVDDLDLQILRLIAPKARMPTTEIAQKLDVTAATINTRIKNLQKSGVIKGFKIEIIVSKLGYNYYRLDIDLKEYKYRQKINNYIIANPHVRSRYISLGNAADLEYEINLKNVNHLHKTMEDITTKFPNSVRNYRYHTVLERHKNRYLPDY